jgi:hypothetical protein
MYKDIQRILRVHRGLHSVTRTSYPEYHEDSYITCVLSVIWNKIGPAVG